MEVEENKTGVQAKSSVEHLKPWQYKKGQSGNPTGRAKGISLKEYVKMKFATMTDDEREDFINGMDKVDLFKMAEGMPQTNTDITTGGKPFPIMKLNDVHRDNSNPEDKGTI
jgi:hypothetical protein